MGNKQPTSIYCFNSYSKVDLVKKEGVLIFPIMIITLTLCVTDLVISTRLRIQDYCNKYRNTGFTATNKEIQDYSKKWIYSIITKHIGIQDYRNKNMKTGL